MATIIAKGIVKKNTKGEYYVLMTKTEEDFDSYTANMDVEDGLIPSIRALQGYFNECFIDDHGTLHAFLVEE